ncbi:MAG: 2-C-methyl-D-erythritol 2,4-cyclodiphosphate synthase [Acidimicrobiales bacterium]|nr:2-C-methyl-D-erythritol 2,4-cyclodiphosphate synthase [Actinomycetota bacterium]
MSSRRGSLNLPRIGQGFDIHPFSDDPARRLILGGVAIDGPGLVGHSDADVVAHAVADALLGAAGEGDLGTMFPASEQAWADADSMVLLARVMGAKITPAWEVGNVDITIIAEAPRLAPHVAAMADRVGQVVGADVSVKPKRAETLGALGRGEGIACLALTVLGRR